MEINEKTCAELIAEQFSEYAHLEISSVEKQGHDDRGATTEWPELAARSKASSNSEVVTL